MYLFLLIHKPKVQLIKLFLVAATAKNHEREVQNLQPSIVQKDDSWLCALFRRTSPRCLVGLVFMRNISFELSITMETVFYYKRNGDTDVNIRKQHRTFHTSII